MEMEYFKDNLLWQYDKTELYVFVLVSQGHARAFEEQLKKLPIFSIVMETSLSY